MCDLWIDEQKPNASATMVAPSTQGKRVWTDGEQLYVMHAVWCDKGYSANLNIKCPVCRNQTLSYKQASIFDMSAWCSNCQSGIKQGKGASDN